MNRLCMGCMGIYDKEYDICPHCGYIYGTPAREAYHIPPGSSLCERYIVGRVLGFGGFGITYIGYDTILQKKVAVKEYLPSEFSTRTPQQQAVTVYPGESEEQFKAGLNKILDEARRLAKFADEPNIVHIYDCFESNNTAYIIMEYLDGESLKERMGRDGKLTVEEALPIIFSVLSALKRVHADEIIHRDIAPDNIYMLKTGEIKLLDFGAARYATTQHSKSLSVILKPGYAPEEQYRSRGDQGSWTDVYALAATFYKLITGITPEDAMERSVKDTVKEPSKLGIAISKPVETALMNAMNVKIEDRTQTAEEFEAELLAAEVKKKNATIDKADHGKVPLWVKAAAAGALVLAIIFVGVLSSGVIPMGDKVAAFVTEKGKTRVPDVRNEEQTLAVAQISKAELLPVLKNAEFSEEVMGGRVIAQSLEGGNTVDLQSEVSLTISAGKELLMMPRLIGLTKEEAVKKLDELGITYTLREQISNAPEGTVAEQSVEDSVQLEKQSAAVDLTISLGMGSFTEIKYLELPNLEGRDIEEVKSELAEYGISVQEENNDYSKDVEKGKIMSQSPATGEKSKTGDTVVVSVSLGVETVQMPLIELISQDEAIKLLDKSKLSSRIEKEYSDSVSAGMVIRSEIVDESGRKKEIKAQELLEVGSEIIVYVSSGRKPQETNSKANTQKKLETKPQNKKQADPQNQKVPAQQPRAEQPKAEQPKQAPPQQAEPPKQAPVEQPVQQPAPNSPAVSEQNKKRAGDIVNY